MYEIILLDNLLYAVCSILSIRLCTYKYGIREVRVPSIYLSSAIRSQSRYYHKTGVISLFFFPILCFLRGLFCSMGEKMTQTKKNSNIKSRHIRVNCVHFSTRSRHIAAKQSWRLLPVGTIGPHKFDVFWNIFSVYFTPAPPLLRKYHDGGKIEGSEWQYRCFINMKSYDRWPNFSAIV